MSSSSCNAIEVKKANKDLTEGERKAKRELKRELKLQRKRARWEIKLRHAVRKQIPTLEQEARSALEAIGVTVSVDEDPKERAAVHFVEDMYNRLKQRQRPSGGFKKANKAAQTDQAKALLAHMTKGTQSTCMFDNEDALWGYARIKFQERAILVYNSLAMLNPTGKPTDLSEEENRKRTKAWDALREVKSICSVGCGPGCDAAGVIAFKDQYASDKTLSSMVLLDWAMDQWKTVVDLLEPLLVPSVVENINSSTCDITEPISDANINAVLRQQPPSDLYLFSYILTETRDKWGPFMTDMISIAKSNSLFYFAEPTPWQLHQLQNMFPDLEYTWLDSSCNESAAMQALDGRLGPGVLLARKA